MVFHKKLVGQIYQNELAYNLRQLGYEIEAKPHGQFELKGFSRDLLDRFSTRRQQRDSYLAQTNQRPTPKTKRQAVLHTRKGKQVTDWETLEQQWQQRMTPAELDLLDAPLAPESDLEQRGKVSAAAAAIAGIQQLQTQEFQFKRETLEQFVLENYLGHQSWNQLEQALDESPQLQAIDESKNLYTTPLAASLQQACLQRIEQGKGAMPAIAAVAELAQVPTEFLTSHRRQALEQAVTTTDQFVTWQDRSENDENQGSYAEQVYRQFAQQRGYRIRELDGAEPQLDHELSSSSIAQTPEVWIVRQAESLSVPAMHRLLETAQQEQARVLLLGDTHRLPPKHVGNPLKVLQQDGLTTIGFERADDSPAILSSPYSRINLEKTHAQTQKTEAIDADNLRVTQDNTNWGRWLGIRLATRLAASLSENRLIGSAGDNLNRSTHDLARSLESFGGRDAIANHDPESIAQSVTDFAERRTCDRVVPEIVGAVGQIHDHLQCIGNNVKQIGGYLRPVEPDRLEEVFRKLAAAGVARSAKQLLELAGTTAPDGTRSLVDAPLNCTIEQRKSTLTIRTHAGQENFAYDLQTQQYHTHLSTSALEKSSRVLQARIEQKTEELRYQHLLALVDLAADLKLPPPPPGFLSLTQRDQLQKQEDTLRKQVTEKREGLQDLRLQLEGAELLSVWQLGRNKIITQKTKQRDQLEQEVRQLNQQRSQATKLLQQAEAAYKIEKQRQKDLYQTLSEQVEHRLPGLEQQETDRSVATLILVATPPNAERELHINSLRFSPAASKVNQSYDSGATPAQNYQEQMRQLAEQNLEWFRQQVERHQRQEKQRQKEAQRKQQVKDGEKRVPEQATTLLSEAQEQAIPATIHDQAEPSTNNQLKQSQQLLEAIQRAYEPIAQKPEQPTQILVGDWIAWVDPGGGVNVVSERQIVMRGNIITGKVLTPLSEEATLELEHMWQEHQQHKTQLERSPMAEITTRPPATELEL